MRRPVHRQLVILPDGTEQYQIMPLDEDDDEKEYERLLYDDIEARGTAKHNTVPTASTGRPALTTWLCLLAGTCVTTMMYDRYYIFSSVQTFMGIAVSIIAWVCTSWTKIALARRQKSRPSYHFSRYQRTVLNTATALVVWWTIISIYPERKSMVSILDGNGDKYFIAVNLHNNEAILPGFTRELTSLAQYIGLDNVFISIYESNSWDRTPALLTEFRELLDQMGIPNRIVTVGNDPGGQFPYSTSPERIEFLARARNKVMEPIQSPSLSVRLADWDRYSKIIFLNDIRFEWRDIVRLIATRVEGKEDEDYDVACALDFGRYDFYDTWVTKDICGTPFHGRWPFVADRQSQRAVRDLKPFPVTSCWNGAVVFNSKPFLYGSDLPADLRTGRHLAKRGWKMVDDPTDKFSRHSPPLDLPIHFRNSSIDACDHSESFLFSYDLHRLYAKVEGRPRILLNPAVQVAYTDQWFYWNNTLLRQPVIRWWRRIWSQGIAFWLFNRPFERILRVRDYCTWAALKIPVDRDRCPPLPGQSFRHWWQ